MADVILIYPKAYSGRKRRGFARPPLGLLSLAAPLVRSGLRVAIIDQENDPGWRGTLDRELSGETVCVGISARTGRQIREGLDVCAIVKERGGTPVVWGGVHASMLPEQTLSDPMVDFVVAGEGEDALLRLVGALRGGTPLEAVPNLWWKEGGALRRSSVESVVDLDRLPPLPYGLLDCEKYIAAAPASLGIPGCRRVMELNTDRGCPHRCGFCYNISVNRCRWRGLSAAAIVERIARLVEDFDLDGIHFTTLNFFADRRRVREVCEGLIRRGVRVGWLANCRVDYFARYEAPFIELLRRSGCRTLVFGVESGAQRTLDLMDKGIRIDDILRVNEKLKRSGIGAKYHFMVGLPEESREEARMTLRLMLRLHRENPDAMFIGPHMYSPSPGTPLYEKCVALGYRPPEDLAGWAHNTWETMRSELPFLDAGYRRWLRNSAFVADAAFPGGPETSRISWLKWWFRLRLRIIARSGRIGPLPEKTLVPLLMRAGELIRGTPALGA